MSFISRTALNLANSTAWGISLELLNWLLWYRLAQASRDAPEINSRDRISLELLNWLLWYRLAQASRDTPEINSRDK